MMKQLNIHRFIRRTLLFILLSFGAKAAIFSFNRLYYDNLTEVNENTVFAGNSVIKAGLDPALFHSAINIAQENEPIFVTFYKLKYLLERFSSIDTVVVSFNLIDIVNTSEEKFKNPTHSKNQVRHSFAYMPIDAFAKNTKADMKDVLMHLYQSECLYPKFKNSVFENNFSPIIRDYPHYSEEQMNRVLRRRYYNNNAIADFSSVNIEAYQKIISLCQKMNKQLILIATPTHPVFYEKIPQKFKDKHAELREKWQKEKNVIILNLTHLLNDDSYFPDNHHVNLKGAKRLSAYVREHLERIKHM